MILVPDVKDASPEKKLKKLAPTDTDSVALSYKTLDNFIGKEDDYNHDVLDIP